MIEFSNLEIFRLAFSGRLNAEQREYYIANLMSAEEKEIGKPLFEMNHEEEMRYKVLEYNNKQEPPFGEYDCPICKNKGDIQVIKDGAIVYRTCECADIRRAKRALKNSSLGNMLNVYTFDKYIAEEDWQRDILTRAKNYVADNSNKWFVILGQSGCGKSHICTAIAKELFEKRIPVYFAEWLKESVKLKQSVTDGGSYQKAIERLTGAQALFIDDLFKGENNTKPTPADVKLAMEILNARYNLSKSKNDRRYVTIISSERTMQQFIEYDEATAGRIAEMAKPDYFIQVAGKEKNYRFKDGI